MDHTADRTGSDVAGTPPLDPDSLRLWREFVRVLDVTPPGGLPPAIEAYLGETTDPDRSRLRRLLEAERERRAARSPDDLDATTGDDGADGGGRTETVSPGRTTDRSAPGAGEGAEGGDTGGHPGDIDLTGAFTPGPGRAGASHGPAATVTLDAAGETAPASPGGGSRPTGPHPVVPRYEILGVLGRGGMGVVYKARQVGLDRLVALKMILSGAHAPPEELERFRAEGLAVARLRHPNIVQIFDVGEHDGLPFFSLEYVEGGNLAKRLGHRPIPPREAAALAATLARAIAAAHRERIVHRDLKPANVLLTDEGQPKITDFGLAKLLEDDSKQTRTGAVMGTPSYMAPEQAWGRTDAIGPPADIYALGAMLYEMLAGAPPFQGVSTLDTLDQVRHKEPVPPSQLQPKLPRDLETICLKALQKEPARRYATADDLADDLQRFLQGQPIRARPVSAAEHAWRWARRNPGLAGLGAAVALLLVAVAVGSTAFSIRLAEESRRARDAANRAELARAAEAQARGEAVRSNEVAVANLDLTVAAERKLILQVQHELKTRPELTPIREKILRSAMADLDRVKDFAIKNPLTARTDAGSFVQLGQVYLEYGRVSDAAALYDAAQATLADQARQHPDDPVTRRNLAAVKNAQGDVALRLGHGAKARELYGEGLALRREWSAMLPDHTPARQAIAESLNLLGRVDLLLGDPQAARGHYEQCLKEYEALPATLAERPMTRRDRASLEEKLGEIRLRLGDVPGAERHHRAAQERRLALFKETNSPVVLRDIALSQYHFGDLYQTAAKDPRRAWAEYQKAHRNFTRLLAANPQGYDARRDLAMLLYRLGDTAERLRAARLKVASGPEPAPPATYFADCLRIREELARIDPKDTQARIEWMIALARCGRHAEAEALADGLLDQARGDPRLLFQSACALALCAREADAPRAARARDRALEAVADLIKHGWKDRFTLESDPDLEPIRDDPRFTALLAALPPVRPAPR